MFDSARNPLTLARYELKRLRGPLPRLAIVFILLIPLLYGCIYLSGNWDPYGRLDQVPVAIVNHDVPTTVKGKEVAAGRDFVDSLHRTATFDFVDASAADALIRKDNPDMTQAMLDQARDKLRDNAVVDGGDAALYGLGAMTEDRWRAFFEATSQTGVYDPGLNWREAFTNAYLPGRG